RFLFVGGGRRVAFVGLLRGGRLGLLVLGPCLVLLPWRLLGRLCRPGLLLWRSSGRRGRGRFGRARALVGARLRRGLSRRLVGRLVGLGHGRRRGSGGGGG